MLNVICVTSPGGRTMCCVFGDPLTSGKEEDVRYKIRRYKRDISLLKRQRRCKI
jgi:hypothetical protein